MWLWGALEVLAEDLSLAWIEHSPNRFQQPQVASVKVPFESMLWTDRERAKYVLDQLTVGTGRHPGVAQLEATLAVVGLDGPVSEDVRRLLLSLSQCRHVIVHRAGEVDRRFVQLCPWMGHSVGDRLSISRDQYYEWSLAAMIYVLAIVERLRLHFELRPLEGESGDILE